MSTQGKERRIGWACVYDKVYKIIAAFLIEGEQSMDRQPILVVTKGPIEGARYPVESEGLTIGRDEECSVILDDANVSRFHARLVFHNAAIWVQDAGSRNGVFLNGKRVVRHKQLSPGDELVIGEHAFTLELEMQEVPLSLTGSIVDAPVLPPKESGRNPIIIGIVIALVLGGLFWLGIA